MGASSNGSQRAAEQAERQRMAEISATQGNINRIFDSPEREAQRQQYAAALRDLYQQDLSRQKGTADRDLKFAMARMGLTGGSASVDQGRRLGEDYQRGVVEAERRTQGGVADLLGRDEASRANLIAMAQSGLSTGQAAQQAAGALRANLEGSRADATVSGLGDIFGSVADVRRRSEEASERRRADLEYYGNLYSPMFGGGGSI